MSKDEELESELRAQAARARALAEFAHAVNVAVEDLDASLRIVAERTAEALGDSCSINLLSEDGRFVEAAARHSADPRLIPLARAFDAEGPLPIAEFAYLGVFERGETVFVPELTGPRAELMRERMRERGLPADILVRGLMAIPLRSRGVVIGVLTISRTDPALPAYTDADRKFAEQLALCSALAIDNARLFRRARSASAALSLSEQRLQAIFAAAPVGIVTRDLEGRVTAANDAYARMLGLGPDQTPDGDGAVSASGDLIATLVEAGGTLGPIEQRYRRGDGSELDARVTTAVVEGEAGSPRFLIEVVEDVTEQRRLEEQLRQSQKMEALGRLAGGLSHDFNNLLTAILGFGESLAAQLAEDRPELAADAGEVVVAATRGSALTRQLLAFSRRQIVERRPIDLGEVCGGLAAMLGRLLGDNIELVIETTRPVVVYADHHQLEQVIVNLAVNGRDAMPAGGTLKLATAVRSIALEHQVPDLPPGQYAVLSVTDEGEGMSPETAARVFEPFFTTKPAGTGTGLGLSTVFGIVGQSGGHVTVYSEPGRGSTFRVLLPLADREPEAAQPAAPPPVAAVTGSRTILLAEDDPAVRELVRRTLEQAGYEVLAAAGGAEALERARVAARIDLLLTDITMPDMSGLEVATLLRERRPELPVLFSSGYASADVLLSQIGGATAFLEKPFSLAELVRSVERTLAGVTG